MGSWSPAVHEYLRYLEAAGFDGVGTACLVLVDKRGPFAVVSHPARRVMDWCLLSMYT